MTLFRYLYIFSNIESSQNESKLLTQVVNLKKRKRQTDKARHAAMTEEQQNEININK
jgi:hypothetical protein